MFKTGLLSDVIINEFLEGIVALFPVVQVIVVELTTTILPHAISSMIMLIFVPKFVPVIVMDVPPILGPNLGVT